MGHASGQLRPDVSGLRWRQGRAYQIVYWSRPLDWKNQTLTPNPDTIYFMPFYNTKDGPVVLEIPPSDEGSITGSIDDGWQNALEDAALPVWIKVRAASI